MATATPTRATIDDLCKVEGKAELIGGRIVTQMPSGLRHGMVGLNIAISLRAYSRSRGSGVAVADGVGFTVPELPSGRESFCPDAAYFNGQMPRNREKFVEGAPFLAVEVRSESDYSPSALREIAAKIEDYFAAGTSVVWDVDPRADTVTAHRAADQSNPIVYRKGQLAAAEPAAPGWTMPVDDIFAE